MEMEHWNKPMGRGKAFLARIMSSSSSPFVCSTIKAKLMKDTNDNCLGNILFISTKYCPCDNANSF